MAIIVYPIFANNGDTVNLARVYDTTGVSFTSDFTAPSWLTLSNDVLSIASNAVSAVSTVLVKIDGEDDFYLVVSPATAPTLLESL